MLLLHAGPNSLLQQQWGTPHSSSFAHGRNLVRRQATHVVDDNGVCQEPRRNSVPCAVDDHGIAVLSRCHSAGGVHGKLDLVGHFGDTCSSDMAASASFPATSGGPPTRKAGRLSFPAGSTSLSALGVSVQTPNCAAELNMSTCPPGADHGLEQLGGTLYVVGRKVVTNATRGRLRT